MKNGQLKSTSEKHQSAGCSFSNNSSDDAVVPEINTEKMPNNLVEILENTEVVVKEKSSMDIT